MTFLLLFLSLLTIHVTPTSFMAGATVRIMCRVVPHADNRSVEAGVGDYMRSARHLEGARAAQTHEFVFPSVPCDTDVAFCAVYQTKGRFEVKQQKLTVAGCDR